jgi:hypothetical protein
MKCENLGDCIVEGQMADKIGWRKAVREEGEARIAEIR